MTLREFISYLMEKGQVLSVSSQRQRDELMELIGNLYELRFLDITLFQYFMIIMIILTGVINFLSEAKIHELLSPGWNVIYYIFNFLTWIWACYFMWLILKFGLGWLVYYYS